MSNKLYQLVDRLFASLFHIRELMLKSMDSLNLRLRTKRTVDKDVYKVIKLLKPLVTFSLLRVISLRRWVNL